jgi:hypothetical protein
MRNLLWMLKAAQEGDDGGLVTAFQHLDHGAVADVGNGY